MFVFTLRFVPTAGTMELEDLLTRYCDRLKHSLFLNSLLIADVGCVLSLVALCAFDSTVSMFLQQCFTNSSGHRTLFKYADTTQK